MASSDPRLHRRAILMLLLATACWGVSFPLMKATGQLAARVNPAASPWFFTSMMVMPRFVLATLVLAVVLGPSLRGITRGEWSQGAMLGGFATLGMLFQADGLQYTSASTSAFLSQFYVILIPLWVAVQTRRNPGGRVWWSVALVLVGVAVLGRFNWEEVQLGRGEAETLLASFFFAGQILTLERPEFSRNRALPLTFVMFLVEGVGFGGLALVTTPSGAALVEPLGSGAWWTFNLLLTVVCTLGAFLLMNTWQPRITSTEAGLLYCVEPVFSSALALVLPGFLSVWAAIAYANERLSADLLWGGGCILAANVLLQLRPPVPATGPTAAG